MGKTKEKEGGGGGFLLPFIVMGFASQAFGGGYDVVCVVSGPNSVSCSDTDHLSKFLSSAGMPSALPDLEVSPSEGETAALLMCDSGDFYPIGVDPSRIVDTSETTTVYAVDALPPCPVPKKPRGRRWGPADGKGGHFCNGRESPDSCKDCCIGVGIAQAGMIAAAGKMYRDSKPGPRGLAADAVVELAAYSLIYWNQQQCNENCGVSYEE